MPSSLDPGRNRRIAVVGTTGTGKTTFASRLARRFECPHVELDALHWEPGWKEAPLDVFRERVKEALVGPRWVVDGNYSRVRDIVWTRADTVVWLDYPLPIVLWRLLRRTVRRVVTREELWNGNRERFWSQFLSTDSLFLWALQTYGRRRREYPVLFKEPRHAHLTVIRLRRPREAEACLTALGGAA
jgi:adenylate kinase family enzyme